LGTGSLVSGIKIFKFKAFQVAENSQRLLSRIDEIVLSFGIKAQILGLLLHKFIITLRILDNVIGNHG